VALSEVDRNLLDRCLSRKPRSWEDFVDRFLGLVVHVINHTSQSRSIRLTPEDREDLAAEVFYTIVADDFANLRRFRGDSSLATYLTVIARRVVVRELLKRKATTPLADAAAVAAHENGNGHPAEERIANKEEVEQLMRNLEGAEADVIRMYHLEGMSYREISQRVGLAENTIGPTLSRAREKMRRSRADAAT
jgi:RNA polymerase sigma-70 factor (ECF subfamily)